jgi:uncharacterized membrane protein YfcA
MQKNVVIYNHLCYVIFGVLCPFFPVLSFISLFVGLSFICQVASATATFVMMFSSSLSVVEFYFLNRFPIPFAVYLICISILAGFWGQSLVRKLVHVLKRASLIVFILSSVIFASALTMGNGQNTLTECPF